tara:strand:+ start:1081 stop:1203 length:123 start_codon:yes stop_codon:yes gene_type:complete
MREPTPAEEAQLIVYMLEQMNADTQEEARYGCKRENMRFR